MGWKYAVLLVVALALVAVMSATGPVLLLPLLPLVPLTAIGFARYTEHRERQREMTCPKCDLRLSYRRLSSSHGMLECPLMCGYKRLVGTPPGFGDA